MLFLFHFWYLFLRTSFYNFWFLFPGYYIVAHFFEVFKYIFEIYSIHWVVSVSPGSLFLLLWVEIYLCAMSRAYVLESFAESWMINELIFAGSIPNVSILMYLLMGSSDYTERNFLVSRLWNKSLDTSIIGGNHWNGSDGIINLYLIPLVKQSILFYPQLFLVSHNLKPLWFNLLEIEL